MTDHPRASAPSIGMPIRLAEQDVGPFRLDLVLAESTWTAIGRTLDAMHAMGLVNAGAAEMHRVLTTVSFAGGLVGDPRLVKAIRMCALQDGMHANDWLRMRFVEDQIPRRKAPAAVDLQIRLAGVRCELLVAKLVKRGEGDQARDVCRVTIRTMRGDVASCESDEFADALDRAMALAGAAVMLPCASCRGAGARSDGLTEHVNDGRHVKNASSEWLCVRCEERRVNAERSRRATSVAPPAGKVLEL